MKPFRRRMLGSLATAVLLGSYHVSAQAITLDLSSPDSIKSAAAILASDTMAYYTGWEVGGTPGNLPAPYYWWEAGALMGTMIDYWYATGDTQYNDKVTQAMLAQVGPDNDYMPPNQTKTEGNDDQAFWGMAAMSAAENNFPNPSAQDPQWLALAQAVFNLQASRWDTTSCGGGLKWQIFTFNTGYNYKNGISNGCFFNIGSRLAVYTGNDTYAQWSEKMWDWCTAIGLMDPTTYEAFDGSDDNLNCSQIDHNRWTYNAGTFMLGAANMYNYTGGSQIWMDRLNGIIGTLPYFFSGNIMMETACENIGSCDVDQQSFKAYLSRWIAATIVRAPYTYNTLIPYLQTSAQAAVKACNGGTGTQCGLKWTTGTYDGLTGVGEQMAALSVVQSNLLAIAPAPVTAHTGGTSKGNPNAGTTSNIGPTGVETSIITTADKAGAGILTALVILSVIGGVWWLIL